MISQPRAVARLALFVALSVAGLAAILGILDHHADAEIAAVGPDVKVFSFTDTGTYGSANGFVGYAVGTRSCNRGDAPLNWCDQASGCAPGAGTEDHPVIAENLYRLKTVPSTSYSRFEQVGMSWLKHGFTSTNSTTNGCAGASGQSCSIPPFGGNQLGVGCTDPYVSSLNGSRPLGLRSEVNATTGVFPFPHTNVGSSTVYDQRLKVATADVDAASNAGALYWAEGQYVAGDDALMGNGLNNASYQRVTIGASPNYPLSLVGGSFVEGLPGVFAWYAADSSVQLTKVDVPSSPIERFHVARKVTDLGGGIYHYEYVVHNLNSDRSARAFSVQFAPTATITNVGFKSIDHHSGEVYATDPWTSAVAGGQVSWSTDTFAVNANANALRFASMFNFWFDADQAPGDELHSLELFKPGSPSSLSFILTSLLWVSGFETGSVGEWSSATP